MARVTDADVKLILTTSIDTSTFITAAHIVIEKVLGASGLTEEHLTELERWLSAHFACMQDPHERSVKADNAEAVFEGQWGLGLDHTRYGQQLKILDTTGKLSQLGKKLGSVLVAAREE